MTSKTEFSKVKVKVIRFAYTLNTLNDYLNAFGTLGAFTQEKSSESILASTLFDWRKKIRWNDEHFDVDDRV